MQAAAEAGAAGNAAPLEGAAAAASEDAAAEAEAPIKRRKTAADDKTAAEGRDTAAAEAEAARRGRIAVAHFPRLQDATEVNAAMAADGDGGEGGTYRDALARRGEDASFFRGADVRGDGGPPSTFQSG